MIKESDAILEDLGYEPKRWRELQDTHYKAMREGKKFYLINNMEDGVIPYEPWEGQRP